MTDEKQTLKDKIDREICKNLNPKCSYTRLESYIEDKNLVAGLAYAEIKNDQYTFIAAGNNEGLTGNVCQTGLMDISNRVRKNTLGKPEKVIRDEKGREFHFNGMVFQDMGMPGLSMMTAAPVSLVRLDFANFKPYTAKEEDKILASTSKYVPDAKVLETCRRMLESWANASGVPAKSENSYRYAAAGRADIQKSLDALNEGNYDRASPITANLWDAGYDYDSQIGGFSLSDLRLIGSVLNGEIKPEEFFSKINRK